MKFIHEDAQFDQLLRAVSGARAVGVALVEKDYWVTHALWGLHEQGFDVWFKGGTSLSKGFGLIARFSEDLDLKVESGRSGMPQVTSWSSEGSRATAERRAAFEWLGANLHVAGATVWLDADRSAARLWRAADVHVAFPALHAASLPPDTKPHVLLEIGNARVVPFLPRDLSAFVHDHLAEAGLASEYVDNRPRAVRCVHPVVTLLEKLDALAGRAPRAELEAASYIRHYEDAAQVVRAFDRLPALHGHGDARSLAAEMLAQRQLRGLPTADHKAFDPLRLGHAERIRDAYDAIQPMYWGPRLRLEEACEAIRTWVRLNLG